MNQDQRLILTLVNRTLGQELGSHVHDSVGAPWIAIQTAWLKGCTGRGALRSAWNHVADGFADPSTDV